MVAGTSYVPERGDVVWLSFTPRAGHEQAGRRPALVLSPHVYNGKVGLAIVCPITSHVKGYPFEVPLPSGLSVSGVVLADQLKSLDWRQRNAELIVRIPVGVVAQVLDRLEVLLFDDHPDG
ncbi:MAG: endoribonuclease MazF [Bradymonadales bacterium]|nr:endoribonuclease MazF [Bradymonadales bacterium]